MPMCAACTKLLSGKFVCFLAYACRSSSQLSNLDLMCVHAGERVITSTGEDCRTMKDEERRIEVLHKDENKKY